MCLLFCGCTLAAFAVDNDIVGMNGAHRRPLSACIQETNGNVQYIQNAQQSVEAVPGANWYLCIVYIGIIRIDTQASVLYRARGVISEQEPLYSVIYITETKYYIFAELDAFC